MAILYVTEFSDIGLSLLGVVQVASWPAVRSQTVVIGAGSLQATAFSSNTRFVRIEADVVCSILISSNPTAASSCARMAADQAEYFAVRPGDTVAVITNV